RCPPWQRQDRRSGPGPRWQAENRAPRPALRPPSAAAAAARRSPCPGSPVHAHCCARSCSRPSAPCSAPATSTVVAATPTPAPTPDACASTPVADAHAGVDRRRGGGHNDGMQPVTIRRLGAGFGATAVLLGAFAAHALKGSLAADELATFETGVR